MINFCQKNNLLEELLEQIKILLREFLTDKCTTDEEYKDALDNYEKWSYQPKIIGEEKCGVLLFVWVCEECLYAKTFVSSYHPTTKLSKLIFHQDRVLNIVNASVNCDQTLLAFAISDAVSRCDNKQTSEVSSEFSSYVAEISPQNRVYSLNIDWNTYQKVQFLDEYPLKSRRNKFRLISFQHKQAIRLYEILINRLDDKVVMSEQPTVQQIAGSFLWSKFDVMNQRLFYMQLMAQDEDENEASGLLTAVEFKGNEDYQHVMNFLLPIPLKMQLIKKQSFYYESYFSNIVSCKSFNMDVLSTPSGTFFVCLQHEVQENRSEEEESDSDSTKSSLSSSRDSVLLSSNPDAGCFINYTVVCVHGGYTLHCSTSFPISAMERVPRVFFKLFNDYLLVYLPHLFIHFLDISCEHEPVHNLLVKKTKLLPKFPDELEHQLFSLLHGGSGSNCQNSMILENHSLNVYQLELNQKDVFKLFLSSKPATRMSILHACMNHFKDKKLTKNIMERVCQDPANADSAQMLKEYLILAPYVQMKRMVASPLDLKIFPFTTQGCYRGQIEKNCDGHRDVYLSYKKFDNDLIRQIQKVLRKNEDDFWKNLLSQLSYEIEYRNRRSPLNLFYLAAVDNDSSKTATAISSSRGRRNTSFIHTIEDSVSEFDYSIVNYSLISVNDDNALEQDNKENEALNNIATDSLVNYITKYFGNDVKVKAANMCREYMAIRCRTITSLWKIIVKSLNKTDESIRYKSLDSPVDEFELAIFQIIERLKVILDQLCYPRLPRMNDLLCTMAFRCLKQRQFLSYLDASVFTVDMSWVRRAIKELSDTPENVGLKQSLIMRLLKPEAQKVLTEWNHTDGNRYLSQQMLTRLPSELAHYRSSSFEEQLNSNGNAFFPLHTLLEAVKSHGKPLGIFRHRTGDSKQDRKLELLSTTALAETNALIS